MVEEMAHTTHVPSLRSRDTRDREGYSYSMWGRPAGARKVITKLTSIPRMCLLRMSE